MNRTRYEAALNRAEQTGCRIVGKGTVKATGLTFYGVQSGANMYHVVVRADRMVCDCAAGQQGIVCKHRCLVHAAMVTRAATVAQKAVETHTDYDSAPLIQFPQPRRLYRTKKRAA